MIIQLICKNNKINIFIFVLKELEELRSFRFEPFTFTCDATFTRAFAFTQAMFMLKQMLYFVIGIAWGSFKGVKQ